MVRNCSCVLLFPSLLKQSRQCDFLISELCPGKGVLMNALLVLCKYDWYLMTKYVDLTSIYDPMVATLAM